jgi:hypothetical protein
MPAPPLAPGQVEVRLGARRYVLNVPDLSPMCRELPGESPEPCAAPAGGEIVTGAGLTQLDRNRLRGGRWEAADSAGWAGVDLRAGVARVRRADNGGSAK